MPRPNKKKSVDAAAAPVPPVSAPEAPPVEGADPRAVSRLDLLIGGALGLLTFIGLFATEKSVGVPRDESFYFRAGSMYAGWFKELFAHPALAFSDDVIRRYFSYNNEHPPLMKELFGLSHWLFHEDLHWVRDIAGYRLPSWALAGAFALVLYLFGTGLKGRAVGLFAVLAFFLSPRDWFDAHLACFDFPVVATWTFTVYAYWRGETSKRWQWLTGIALGLALATKHNAFFIPPVLALYWIVVRGAGIARRQGVVAFIKAIPNTFYWMALLGPLTLFILWPLCWHHPVDQLSFWIGFHLHHVNYAWFYLGDLLREPPFPIMYVWVVTALTVPFAIVVAMALGLFETGWDALKSSWGAFKKPDAPSPDATAWLLLLNCVMQMAIFMPPETPRFGGSKHWEAAMGFACIFAGDVIVRGAKLLAQRIAWKHALTAVTAGVFALVLAPALWGVADIDGYGTSYYNELAEGQAGAAALGMQRQFWSNNVTGVLPWLNETAPQNARVFFHEVTGDSYRAYRDNGMLRSDIQFTGLEQADIACYQYHQEFRFWEYAIWTNMHTMWPAYGLYLDEVPNIECYERDRTF